MTNHLNHVAVIMDGNGRWAQDRRHGRIWGHVRGARVVSSIVEESLDLGVKSLTLFTFSTENWCRPKLEVLTLQKILKKFLILERERITRERIRFRVIGDLTGFSQDICQIVKEIEASSQGHERMNLTLALGYGGRSELIESINRFIQDNPNTPITEEIMSQYLFAPELGDVDLMIRTGGDIRISNFLLWQVAYSELYFSQTQWPDFTRSEFNEIINLVTKRQRRFGSVNGEASSIYHSKMLAKQNLEFNVKL